MCTRVAATTGLAATPTTTNTAILVPHEDTTIHPTLERMRCTNDIHTAFGRGLFAATYD